MTDRDDDGSAKPSPNEAVGYRNPPTYRRFKESGNSKGRPKGSKNRKTIVREVASEMHTVIENGEQRRRSTLELVLLRLRNMALEAKNMRAFDEMQKLLKAYEIEDPEGRYGYLVVPAPMSAEEWMAEQEELNKTRKPPPGYRE